MAKSAQGWLLDVGEERHTVMAREVSWTHREIVWRIDGRIVASKRSSEEKVVLRPGEAVKEAAELAPEADPGLAAGAIRVVFTALGSPRRAIWFEGPDGTARAHTGMGGVDLEPEPGSALAVREARAAQRPTLYAARHVGAGVAKVLLPIVGVWLLARLAGLLPDIDLPGIPLPSIDLPSIPWPDIHLPSIPWPDWELPGWVQWVRERAKYVLPILIGIGLARSEIRRRKSEPGKRAELRRRSGDATAGDGQ